MTPEFVAIIRPASTVQYRNPMFDNSRQDLQLIIRGEQLLLPDKVLVISLSSYCGYFSADLLLLLGNMNSSDDKYSGD